jgi:hypothetical protein
MPTTSQAVTAAARYLVFEILETLLALLSLLLCLGADAVMLIDLWDAQQVRTLQAIYPSLSDLALPAFLALLRLCWCLVFYLWRRRGGLIRLIGQCALCLYLLAAAVFWLTLGSQALRYYETAYFIAGPLAAGLSALIGGILCALPVKALIQYYKAKKELTRKASK